MTIAGIHTNMMCRKAGIPTNSQSHMRSRPATTFFFGLVAGRAVVVIVSFNSLERVRLLLLLDRAEDRVDLARIGDEVGEGRADDVGGEVGVGVAVEELGDVRRRADELDRFLLQRVVPAGVGTELAATTDGLTAMYASIASTLPIPVSNALAPSSLAGRPPS